jgi:hypothetical protein
VNGIATKESDIICDTTFQHAISNFPVGTAAVRALLLDATSGKTIKKSPPYYLSIRPRSTWYQKLILPSN